MKLKKEKGRIYICWRCGDCREEVSYKKGFYKACPVYDVLGFKTHVSMGRVAIARGVLEGLLQYSINRISF